MKKFLLTMTLCLSFIYVNAQINVDSYGNVGVNNPSPSYKFDVQGDCRLYQVDNGSGVMCSGGQFYPIGSMTLGSYMSRWSWLCAEAATFSSSPDIDSDERLKKDVHDFSNVSDKVNQLHAVRYKLINGVKGRSDGEMYGFIAQDVIKLFPEIVTTRENGTYGVRYTELVPVLVKAFQEQQKQIKALEARLDALEKKSK